MQFIAQNIYKKKNISEVQKYTEEYLSVLFTVFFNIVTVEELFSLQNKP